MSRTPEQIRERFKAVFGNIKVALSPNRSSRGGVKPQLVVIHTTESGPDSVWGVVNYFKNDGIDVSSTYVVNDKPNASGYVDVVLCVPESEKPWTQKSANPYSISYELVGRAARTREDWEAHRAQLRTVAALVAEDCVQYGIPVKRAFPGILGHRDLRSFGFPNDHTDPGEDFPWGWFLRLVESYVKGAPPKPKVVKLNVNGRGRPSGVPARIPQWAWERREWHLTGRKGLPPAAPKGGVPTWYWKWLQWSTGTGPHGRKYRRYPGGS